MSREPRRAGAESGRPPGRAPDIDSDPPVSRADLARLAAGEFADPHRILGAHTATRGTEPGAVIRAFHPDASAVDALLAGERTVSLEPVGRGVFEGFVAGATLPLRYRLRFRFAAGGTWERGDPYRFWPTLGEMDRHLFNEGRTCGCGRSSAPTCASSTASAAPRSPCGRRPPSA